MSPVLEDAARRQARARARAASIIDAPRVARRFGVTEDSPLRPTQRRRVHRSEMPRLVPVSMSALSRRRLAVAVLVVQVVALLAILGLPTFRAKTVTISGNHLVGRSAILTAAQISPSQSLFTVDGESVRQRIEKLPWVRSASVETELPSTVRISITEWTPVLMLQRGTHRLAIADSGDVLDLGNADVPAPPGVALVVDNRPPVLTAQLGAATTSLDSTLVRTLVVTAQRFPAAFGVAVDHFEWQSDGLFAIVTTAGWRAILGHMLTDQDVAAVPDQLASLLSLKARLNFTKPSFGYIELENPAQPAVGGKPGAATAVPATGGSNPPQGSATPAPATPTPAPTPKPTPTPIQFNLGRPTP